jgi:hypothetical protein
VACKNTAAATQLQNDLLAEFRTSVASDFASGKTPPPPHPILLQPIKIIIQSLQLCVLK